MNKHPTTSINEEQLLLYQTQLNHIGVTPEQFDIKKYTHLTTAQLQRMINAMRLQHRQHKR